MRRVGGRARLKAAGIRPQPPWSGGNRLAPSDRALARAVRHDGSVPGARSSSGDRRVTRGSGALASGGGSTGAGPRGQGRGARERRRDGTMKNLDVETNERKTIPGVPPSVRPESARPPSSTASSPSEYRDRKSTRLNSSHVKISYAVFRLK